MSRMEDDLLTYKVEISEVTNIPCNLKKEDDSKQQMSHVSDDDMEYDPSLNGDDEVELTDEESSDFDDEDEAAKIFRIETMYLTSRRLCVGPSRSLKDVKIKEEALKNKAIMEGVIDEDDESSNKGWKM
uniref:Uncharacterized protein n=1 Tax=Tanacetum cinerariifolium TaxID=118510 RepID=A0A6L2P368_TANCI|nr:hypothetical protein [Tanacetum cinerariifolium]GEU93752.1 hypothetical protein [Tanacetum cinerariifolium]